MVLVRVISHHKDLIGYLPSGKQRGEIIELRFDLDPELLNYLSDERLISSNVILTVRSSGEGGGKLSSQKRHQILESLMELNFGYLDLELMTDRIVIDQIANGKLIVRSDQLILSRHNYTDPIQVGLQEYQTQVHRYGSEIAGKPIINKFVGLPNDSYATIELLGEVNQHPNQILLAIGPNGDLSRTLWNRIQQKLVFGSHNDSSFLAHDLLDSLSDEGALFLGLLGRDIQSSLSPRIHHAFLRSIKQPGYYHLIDIQDENNAEQSVHWLFENGFNGLNVTIPYKTVALKLLNKLDKLAEAAGAVNTIVTKNGSLEGYNTDVVGFTEFGIRNNFKSLSNAIVLGAGGASRAVCVALLELGLDVTVAARSTNPLDLFPDDLRSQVTVINNKQSLRSVQAEIYVNATPLGANQSDPRDFVPLPKNMEIAVDLRYDLTDTRFVRELKADGIEAHDGKEMLFNQAAASFKLWTGVDSRVSSSFNEIFEGYQV